MNRSNQHLVLSTPWICLLVLVWGSIQARAADPVVTSPPASRSVVTGTPVSFSVSADGTPPLAFYWFKDGVPLANQARFVVQETNLNISAAATSDAGIYTVVVSNSAGQAVSAPASLTVETEWPVNVLGGLPSLFFSAGVAITGNLACVADGVGGLQLISLTNPASPVRLGGLDTAGWAIGVAVSGALACVADSEAGLQIISISNPASPVWLGGSGTSDNTFGVDISGDLACVADGLAGLQIISLTNPASPVRLGGLDTDGWAVGVTIAGDVAYVADGDAGLQIISISNPASPVRLGGYDTAGYAYGVAVVSNVAYVADYNGGLQVISVSNPASPVWLGSYDTAGFAFGVAVASNVAYVASHHAGLQVIDVSNPSHLVRMGGYNTLGQADGVALAGGVICVADGEAGLVTLALGTNSPTAPVLLSQPQRQTVLPGGSTVLAITANGTPPLRYQWYFANSPLSEATNSMVWLTNLQPSQAGLYSMTVSNQTGGVQSENALVTLLFASNQNVITPEDMATNLVLTASDVDSTNLVFAILNNPTNGVVSGFDPDTGALTYTPATNYHGPDAFTFTVSDGSLFATGTVNVTVAAANVPPVAYDQSVITPQDTATNLVLTATDVDSTNLVFAILNSSTNGTLSGFDPNTGALTYTPATNYHGPDAFTFTVSDGSLLATGTVNVTVTAANVPPAITAQPQSLTTTAGSNVTFEVAVSGTGPIGFQWLFNGISLTAPSSQTLVLSNVQPEQAGDYQVVVSNLGGSVTSQVATLTVETLQISGQVGMEAYIGPTRNGAGTRTVTFKATDDAGTVLATWNPSLDFTPGTDGYGEANFTLDSVPSQTTHLSAKTEWHLRKRLAVTFTGQFALAVFLGPGALRGGDLDDSNVVDMADYYGLAASWHLPTAAADIDGNGLVDLTDYFLLSNHWKDQGDQE